MRRLRDGSHEDFKYCTMEQLIDFLPETNLKGKEKLIEFLKEYPPHQNPREVLVEALIEMIFVLEQKNSGYSLPEKENNKPRVNRSWMDVL